MPDYQKLLEKDAELLKTFTKIKRDSDYVYNKSKKIMYIVFDDELDFVYILPEEYKQDELTQYCRKIISNDVSFAYIRKLPYGDNSVRFIKKDLSEFKFPHEIFIETYSFSINHHNFLELSVNVAASFSWLGRYIDSPISDLIYIVNNNDETMKLVIDNITDIKYKFDKNTGKMIVSKIKLNFGTTDFWIRLFNCNLGEKINAKFAHSPDGREALKINNRKRNMIRHAIERDVKKYGMEFVDEFKSLADEDILKLMLTGKLPSVKLPRKRGNQ